MSNHTDTQSQPADAANVKPSVEPPTLPKPFRFVLGQQVKFLKGDKPLTVLSRTQEQTFNHYRLVTESKMQYDALAEDDLIEAFEVETETVMQTDAEIRAKAAAQAINQALCGDDAEQDGYDVPMLAAIILRHFPTMTPMTPTSQPHEPEIPQETRFAVGQTVKILDTARAGETCRLTCLRPDSGKFDCKFEDGHKILGVPESSLEAMQQEPLQPMMQHPRFDYLVPADYLEYDAYALGMGGQMTYEQWRRFYKEAKPE